MGNEFNLDGTAALALLIIFNTVLQDGAIVTLKYTIIFSIVLYGENSGSLAAFQSRPCIPVPSWKDPDWCPKLVTINFGAWKNDLSSAICDLVMALQVPN